VPFTAEAIDRLNPRLSASTLSLLELAWRDRELLLRIRSLSRLSILYHYPTTHIPRRLPGGVWFGRETPGRRRCPAGADPA
jgi:hypothetical protein